MSGSENNGPNLYRSRSTTSVKDRKKHPLPPQPLDPETSRVHAVIAAHRAMDRSQSSSSAEIARPSSSASRGTAAARSQGVRFSPATQLRRHRSALQSQAPHLSAVLRVPQTSQQDDPYVDVIASDFGAATENFGAEPSSYRKIRRARSMLTPRRRLFSNPSSPPHTPLSEAPTLRNATSSTVLTQPGLGLRIKRSLAFLRPASRAQLSPRPDTHLGQNDEAVSLARTQFLSDSEGTRVQGRTSLLQLPKIRHPQKSFRKSVRSSQSKDIEDIVTSDTPSLERPEIVQSKRSFSASLRDRVLRAFGKSVSGRSSLPPQQLEATRRHFSDMDDASPVAGFDNYHVDQDEDRRGSVYIPSKPDVETEEERDRFSPTLHTAGSRESLHSNSRSRVTSWANSSTTTSTVRGPGLERNRLSIIKEDGGPAQPSCSAGRHIGGIGVFQDPLDTENEEGHAYPPVDSQRIYSALMKRIGEEEAEMQETEAALEEIHNIAHVRCDPLGAGKSTIRAVSNNTIGNLPGISNDGQDGDALLSQKQDFTAMSSALHKENVERRKAKFALQEEQSSFYPFSDQGQTQSRSPFRKLLEQRRSEGQSETDDDSVVVGESDRSDRRLSNCKFGLSSESIYSRTTNGGDNPDYIPPVRSSERLATVTQEVDEDTGMATIIPARYRPSERPKVPSADSTERREWKGWMEGELDASLGRRDHSKAGVHYREYAQIDPDDIDVARPESRPGPANPFPLLDLKEVPRNTPAPKRSSSLTKSQSGLLKGASPIGLKSSSERNDENKKTSSGIRKLSPGNIANMLKERKSQTITTKTDDVKKENRAMANESPQSSSPPMSTPGRFGLEMRSGNGRIRKRVSDMAVRSGQKYRITPKNVSTPLESKTGEYDESPTDRSKPSASARITRPFNMEVPKPNRPFDSMFSGGGDLNVGNDRLSTAPNAAGRESKGYGGLGPNPFEDNRDTALPQVRTPSAETALSGAVGSEKSKGGWSSKRMVSDFLKKRRLGRSTSTDDDGPSRYESQSPAAFV